MIRGCILLLAVLACVNLTGCATAKLAPSDAAFVPGKADVTTGASGGFGRGDASRR